MSTGGMDASISIAIAGVVLKACEELVLEPCGGRNLDPSNRLQNEGEEAICNDRSRRKIIMKGESSERNGACLMANASPTSKWAS